MGDSLGARIFDVRLALGDGRRKAMPMREFAALLSQRVGREPPYNASFVSRWENDESAPRLDEIELIASVDPLHRGRSWLAFGEPEIPEPGETVAKPYPPGRHTPLSEAAIPDVAPKRRRKS